MGIQSQYGGDTDDSSQAKLIQVYIQNFSKRNLKIENLDFNDFGLHTCSTSAKCQSFPQMNFSFDLC